MSVTVTELGSARVVTWDRQAHRNAWTRETIEAIADGIETAGADEAVRCVIARGAGEHFSAGDDLFAAIEATPESWAATVRAFQRVTLVTLAAPIPGARRDRRRLHRRRARVRRQLRPAPGDRPRALRHT